MRSFGCHKACYCSRKIGSDQGRQSSICCRSCQVAYQIKNCLEQVGSGFKNSATRCFGVQDKIRLRVSTKGEGHGCRV